MILTYDFAVNIEKFRKYFSKKKKIKFDDTIKFYIIGIQQEKAIRKIIHDIINVR